MTSGPKENARPGPAIDPSREARINEVVSKYLERLDRGEIVDQDAILAESPDVAADIAEFFGADAVVARLKRNVVSTAPRVASTDRLESGTTIGDFEILGEVARGGMGVVYRARQRRLGRVVALKVFDCARQLSGTDRQRFRLEAEAVATLEHPNIVPIYEVGEADGRNFIALKFIDGGHLGDRLDDLADRPRDAARLLETVARAVHFAHEHGVLHRDLKPANILVDAEENPHLTDFGLAKLTGDDQELTLTGVVIGTPKYMAPEQALGESRNLTRAVDIYSLGVILYEMIVGEPPFDGPTALEVLHRVRTEEPTPPSRSRARVASDLETICLKCLGKNPVSRYGTALELAEDLRRFQLGEPIRARPTGSLERMVKWTRRRPALATLTIVTALALAGFVVSNWFHRVRYEEIARLERQKAAELRHFQYAREIKRVVALVTARDYERARTALEWLQPGEEEVDLRDFEWFHARSLFRREVARFSIAGARRVFAVGHGMLAAIEGPNEITLRRVPSLEELSRVPLADAGSARRIWIANENTLFVQNDRERKVVDVETGRVVRSFPLEAGSYASRRLAFSPDGRLYGMVEGADNTSSKVSVYETSSHEVIQRRTTEFSSTLGFSADGERFMYGRNALVTLDTRTWNPIFTTAIEGTVSDAALLPDGSYIAVAGQDRITPDIPWLGPSLSVHSLSSGANGHQLVAPSEFSGSFENVVQVAISSDGRVVVSGTESGDLIYFEMPGGRRIRTVDAHSRAVDFLEFSDDGRYIVSASSQDQLAKVWDARAFSAYLGRAHDHKVWDLATNGTTFVTGSDHVYRVWSITTSDHGVVVDAVGDLALDFQRPLEYGTLSANGDRVAVGDANGRTAIYAIDSTVSGVDARLEGVVEPGFPTTLYALAFGPHARRLLASYKGGKISEFRLTGSENNLRWTTFRHLERHEREFRTIVFSPDATTVSLAHQGGSELYVWDAVAFEPRHLPLEAVGQIRWIAYSPDGRCVACSTDVGMVHVWSLETGENLWTFQANPDTGTDAIVFSPSGRRLATGSDDGVIKLWDLTVADARSVALEVLRLEKHEGAVTALRFTPNGGALISVGGVEDEDRLLGFGEVGLWSGARR